jgi:hypothetical protein
MHPYDIVLQGHWDLRTQGRTRLVLTVPVQPSELNIHPTPSSVTTVVGLALGGGYLAFLGFALAALLRMS